MLRLKLKKAEQIYPYDKKIIQHRSKNTVYIGLGSNIGNRIKYLREAVKRISELIGEDESIVASSVYETKPYGNIDQANFLNAVIKISTSLELNELFKFLKLLEKKIGRSKRKKWGPREIDLDILFFNQRIFLSEKLVVPHPGVADRDFVLIPLNEIAKDFEHPVLKKKISDICSKIISENIIRRTNLKII